MASSQPTLSLADVAKLAGVQRPVVSMWRKRVIRNQPFPSADDDGRFVPEEVVDWLEATGRGNNPDARVDLAIQAAISASIAPQHRATLAALLAARAILDEPLASYGLEDLLDEIDALDPDDDFLFSELEALDEAAYPDLAKQADAITDAAWNPRAAYERLLDAQPGPEHDSRLHPDLIELLAGLCRAMLGSGGEVIDVQGTCCDVVVTLCSDEDQPSPAIAVVSDAPCREVQRRYRVHGVAPAMRDMTDDWSIRPGSITLVRIADQGGFDVLDEARLQLAKDSVLVVVGPASQLTDKVPSALEVQRDEFVRQDRPQSAVLRAAVRLPAGLTRGGSRQHLALWLVGPVPKRPQVWVGDISGATFDGGVRQALLDDLLAAIQEPRGRAFTLLRAAKPTTIAAHGGCLVSLGRPTATTVMVAAADDSVRLDELRRALTTPMPDIFTHQPTAIGDGVLHQISLGDAHRAKQINVLSGVRLSDLPVGATPLWTSEAVAKRRPASVDLLTLTQQHPTIRLTEPRDVVFTTAGKPAAVLDMDGGAAVAYPARVLRVTGGTLCPAAIADAINAVPAGNSKWRTWTVPETQIDPALANEILESLHGWENQLRYRQTLLDELRLLVRRSILSGAIHLTDPHEQKGP